MSTRRGWKQHEKDIQFLFGLDSTSGSGNKWYDKGDGVDRRHYSEDDFQLMVECKYTEAKSYSVTAKLMGQFIDQAQEAGKRGVLAIRLWPKQAVRERDYVVLTADDFKELMEKAKDG